MMISFYAFKYISYYFNGPIVIAELSLDNSLGALQYGARSNIRFVDIDGDIAHCVGSGASQEDAITEFENNLLSFLKSNNRYNIDIMLGKRNFYRFQKEDVVLPLKIVLSKNDRKHLVFIKDLGEKLQILTSETVLLTEKCSIEVLVERYKDFIVKSDSEIDITFRKRNGFYPIFDDLII